MENASKALLMAGGMLLAILILTLLIYAWNLFSNFQSSNDELANIENTAKFNQQFTNYNRDDVQGYELISLVNQVVDYNQRKSTTGQNDEKYNPITVSIYLINENNRKSFSKDFINRLIVSPTNTYAQSNAINTFKNLIDSATSIENIFGGNDCANRIAKNYDSIFLSSSQVDEEMKKGFTENEVWNNAIKKYNSLTTKTVATKSELLSKSDSALKYYEYMQFKRGVFKCSKLEYDGVTGRVSIIEFEFTGKIH